MVKKKSKNSAVKKSAERVKNLDNSNVVSSKSQNLSLLKGPLNYWMIASILLAAVLIIVLASVSFSGISKKTAEERFLEFANAIDPEVRVKDVKSIGDLYEIEFESSGQVFSYHISKDGKYIGSMEKLDEVMKSVVTGDAVSDIPVELVKSDKPDVELFVMTHCPYGTQAEKGFILFADAMVGKINAKIRFVHYFMHEPEYDETPRQLCIREEQTEKYEDYLKCFLEGDGIVDPGYGLIMEGNDPSVCMKEVGVDTKKVETCVNSGKWEEYYQIDSTLSQAYGVQGSPTLVVNGVQVSSGRSPAAYLSTICNAFNNVPEECSTLSLSTATPDPYFGWEGSSEVYGSGGLC